MNGHVRGAGKLLSEVLSQQEEEVPRAKERRLREFVLLVVCWVIALCWCRLGFPSLLMETAKRDVHTKSGMKDGDRERVRTENIAVALKEGRAKRR